MTKQLKDTFVMGKYMAASQSKGSLWVLAFHKTDRETKGASGLGSSAEAYMPGLTPRGLGLGLSPGPRLMPKGRPRPLSLDLGPEAET